MNSEGKMNEVILATRYITGDKTLTEEELNIVRSMTLVEQEYLLVHLEQKTMKLTYPIRHQTCAKSVRD